MTVRRRILLDALMEVAFRCEIPQRTADAVDLDGGPDPLKGGGDDSCSEVGALDLENVGSRWDTVVHPTSTAELLLCLRLRNRGIKSCAIRPSVCLSVCLTPVA